MKRNIIVNYGPCSVTYSFLYPKTMQYFTAYGSLTDQPADIRMTEERFELCRSLLPPDKSDEYVESKGLIPLTSQRLLPFDSCIFHGVSFLFREGAWILTAPSGTGKTTQYLNWKKAHPDEIQIICGDMPVFEKKENRIQVHCSPWNGKEKLGSHLRADLKGIILLEQGKENRISKVSPAEGIADLFRQFAFTPFKEEEILTVTSMMECIFRNYPVCRFINTGDMESTEVLRNEIERTVQ